MGKFFILSHRTSCGTESKAFLKSKENTLTIFAPRSNHSSQVCHLIVCQPITSSLLYIVNSVIGSMNSVFKHQFSILRCDLTLTLSFALIDRATAFSNAMAVHQDKYIQITYVYKLSYQFSNKPKILS